MRIYGQVFILLVILCVTFKRGCFGYVGGNGGGYVEGDHDGHSGYNSEGREGGFTGEYAVHIKGGPAVAQEVARELGYTFHGQVSFISWLLLATI